MDYRKIILFVALGNLPILSSSGSELSNIRYTCANGKDLPTFKFFCDGDAECDNGTDEIRNNSSLNTEDRLCPVQWDKDGCLLSKNMVCDNASHCHRGIDECLCEADGMDFVDKKCFRCLSHPHIVKPIGSLCDNKFDCPDLSDECLCNKRKSPEICNLVNWDAFINNEKQPTFSCPSIRPETSQQRMGHPETFTLDKICDKNPNCENGIDERNCTYEDNRGEPNNDTLFCAGITAYRCNRHLECPHRAFEEECQCPEPVPEYCRHIIRKRISFFSPVMTFVKCKDRYGNTATLPLTILCNGFDDCLDGEDEAWCPNVVYCETEIEGKTYIQRSQIGDQIKDCKNGSDEEEHSFQCKKSLNYIKKERVCDHQPDCEDGSDECQPGCVDSLFSDEESMIKHNYVLVFAWIISLSAVLGNVMVAIPTIIRLQKRKMPAGSRITRCLFLSLATSDSLVGIYTFAICVVASVHRKEYCLYDKVWRSNVACDLLGTIFVIGSQQSVFTMILIAVSRAVAVVRPFSKPPYKVILLSLAITWTASISLATIPLTRSLEDTFVGSVWFTDAYPIVVVEKKDVVNLTTRLLPVLRYSNETFDPSLIGTWSLLDKLVSKLSRNTKRAATYGFYSTHSVCLPKLFPNGREPGWWYSLIFLILNFVSFLIIAAAYVAVYYGRTNTEKRLEGKNDAISTGLRRKATIVVLTDFLCWIPVCVIGFIHLTRENSASESALNNQYYLPIALIVLPINAALNPFIYSAVPWFVWGKFQEKAVSFKQISSKRFQKTFRGSFPSEEQGNSMVMSPLKSKPRRTTAEYQSSNASTQLSRIS